MDKRLNNGFICEKHGIGYITKCPTCAFEETKRRRRNGKNFRRLLRK
jgi:hypothetical protein